MTDTGGFVKLMRTAETTELLEGSPDCFLLLTIIAFRARRSNGFNRDGLQPGQALIGDYKSYGLTEQRYRTSKVKLEKWRFATFKATTKGTIATLLDSRIYDINIESDNGQDNGQLTDKQRTSNGQLTTNKNERMKEWKKINTSPVKKQDGKYTEITVS